MRNARHNETPFDFPAIDQPAGQQSSTDKYCCGSIMRRSQRLSRAKPATETTTHNEPKNKRPRRTATTAPLPAATAAAAASATPSGNNRSRSSSSSNTSSDAANLEDEESDAESLGGDGDGDEKEEEQEGPSAYELQRLAKMKQNAMMMASLGLSGAKGEMRTAISNDAAQRAKARGLGARPKFKGYPARTRYAKYTTSYV